MKFSPTDFAMGKTPASFKWHGESRPGLPLIRWLDGTIFWPSLTYFAYLDRTSRHRLSHSSMMKQAYALREWLCFLANRKRDWSGGRDLWLHEWRESQRSLQEPVSDDQIERKLAWVFDFYREIHKAMPFDRHGVPVNPYVSDIGAPVGAAPIASKEIVHDGHRRQSWQGQKQRKTYVPDPTVPSSDSVQRVLTALQSPPSHDSALDRAKTLQRDGHLLMALTMAGGGLRAIEVARLRVTDITIALRKEGLLDHLGGCSEPISCVSELSNNTEAREALHLRIKSFVEKRRRRYFFVRIVGKGDKPRDAPFLPDLVADLLDGIWNSRHQLIEMRKSRSPDYVAPQELFLSSKTGAAYKAGSVSDILKKAFVDAGVTGGGHRLRRFYATRIASLILEENINRVNGHVNDAVVSTVWNRVADALGHSEVTTTIKHYVDMALVHWTGVRTKNRRSKVMRVWETLTDEQEHFTDEKINLSATVIKAIAQAQPGSNLLRLLQGAMRDPTLNPGGASTVVVTQDRSHLREVPK